MQVSLSPLYKKLLFNEQQINNRIEQMAADIIALYKDKDTVFVGLLNGSQPFTAKLMFAIHQQDPHFHPNIQSMIISRYGTSRMAGQTQVVTDLPPSYRDLNGRHVVLLDDMIDGGGTLDFATRHLQKYGAKQVDRIVLIKKLKSSPITADLTMYGFEAPDEWLTGMGMDDERLGAEGNRWAGWVAIAAD
jgi:hypoxanthine phosphoribosyltransferase